MKQHINMGQLEGLTLKQILKLAALTGVEPDMMQNNIEDVSKALTIGKMIEILESTDEFLEIVRLAEGDKPYIVHLKSGLIYHADNLCDALWEAVKATL
jgi:hypothetical protein